MVSVIAGELGHESGIGRIVSVADELALVGDEVADKVNRTNVLLRGSIED